MSAAANRFFARPNRTDLSRGACRLRRLETTQQHPQPPKHIVPLRGSFVAAPCQPESACFSKLAILADFITPWGGYRRMVVSSEWVDSRTSARLKKAQRAIYRSSTTSELNP